MLHKTCGASAGCEVPGFYCSPRDWPPFLHRNLAPRLIPSTMPPKSSTTAAIKSTATVPTSTVFCADDADVVIRAAGLLDFRAHKSILSLASPVFKEMFTIPQPPTDTPGILPHADVQDSPVTWANLLGIIYPMQNPVIDDLGDLESLLLAAQKYQMQSTIDVYKKGLEDREFIRGDPLRLYAIACRWGFRDQAKYVARNAELLTVTKRSNAGDLTGLTVSCYHSLVSFLAERDSEWHEILDASPISLTYIRGCDCKLKEGLYNKIKENLKRPYLQVEEIYLIALEERSLSFQNACNYRTDCSLIHSNMKEFIERMIVKREGVCDKFIDIYKVGTSNET